jgi:ABC-2 type transport system ATP-binding protein
MPSNYAIQSQSLRKEFGKTIAVRGLNLEVARGEVFGFLGPNGAGKTTSLKMFLGLVAPTSGSAEVLGKKPTETAMRAHLGFLPEHFRFHEWLTGQEFLTLHGNLYSIKPSVLDNRIDELLDLVNLSGFREKQLRTYSKGMLQRIGLAQALLNHPELVFLDEPTSGLDPVGRRLVRDVIRSLKAEGTTVFLNSHLLSEVEITCDRVAFIKFGEVLHVSSLSSLVDGETTLSIRVRSMPPDCVEGLSAWAKDIRLDGDTLHMVVLEEDSLPVINRYLVDAGAQVYAFAPQKLSLEDLFIQIVGTDGGL